jgi:hypothetical protein
MRWALVLVVCSAALVLGGCGGGDDSASTSSSATARATTASTPQTSEQGTQVEAKDKHDKGKPGGSSAKEGNEDNSPPKKHLHLVRVPPISSRPIAGSRHPAPGVKTVAGGDNSVQEYGVEADASERTEAAIALQGYLNARAQEDWSRVCSLLAKKPMEQIEKMQKAAAAQGKDLGSCEKTVALLREAGAQSIEQAKIAEVLSFRGGGDLSGDPSYLIFTAPPSQTLYSMPMYLQGGSWKVGLARAAELPVG